MIDKIATYIDKVAMDMDYSAFDFGNVLQLSPTGLLIVMVCATVVALSLVWKWSR